MEIFIGFISFGLMIFGLGEILSAEHNRVFRNAGIGFLFGISGPILFSIVWIIGNTLISEKITIHTNVLEYKSIVYSIPKEITEKKTIYPWWSIREDIEYKAQIK